MGGCRCTYRNCTVRSDGKTHMFHYPVFDKVRCHQWLMNAQRQDFLNLKVSQLKNRVVCQHHFKNDNFMNFRMDKLTFDAVPTEDGPFCDYSREPKHEVAQEVATVYPITVDDIENDQLSFNEKRANFSVKYADFLTNCEIDSINATIDRTLNLTKNLDPANSAANNSYPDNGSKFTTYMHTHRISLPAVVNKKYESQPMLVVPPFSDYDNKISIQGINDATNADATNADATNKITFHVSSDNNVDVVSNSVINTPKSSVRKNNRIKIIAEKKITTPLPLKGKHIHLEPVSPSLVLRPRNKRADNEKNHAEIIDIQKGTSIKAEPQAVLNNVSNVANQQVENNYLIENVPKNMSLLKNNKNIQSSKSSGQTTPVKNIIIQSNNTSNLSSPNASMTKSKIPPERVAAIQEKRSFNKKLRDMIEFCLDDQDTNVKDNTVMPKTVKESRKNIYKPVQTMRTRKSKEKAESDKNIEIEIEEITSKEPSMPSVIDFNISSLEARLQMMEDTLLKRIDQNSKQIVDLKNNLGEPSALKRSMTTQTTEFDNEESHKKYLYKQISEFLSPEANSLIYEELFINRYVPNPLQSSFAVNPLHSQPKRRRRREY